ncbi:hypothetical protein QN277_025127 [Acacia crassicarpa]|uniref:Uncharacterized protein n=1 Tax=Acacia crassicarpa TaxID=499986 RepID=A0AAE1JGT4_9FABA|nr:hypothetical protein QN277_025127 [Acacia crassicarpa]
MAMRSIVYMMSSVILRKCLLVYNECSYLFIDVAFLLVSSLRFSGLIFRQSSVVPVQRYYRPFSP